MNDDGKIADEIYPLWWKTAFVTEACMAISERGDRSQNPDRLVWAGLFAIMGDIENKPGIGQHLQRDSMRP